MIGVIGAVILLTIAWKLNKVRRKWNKRVEDGVSVGEELIDTMFENDTEDLKIILENKQKNLNKKRDR